MKILAIIGSPRSKGNTYTIVQRIVANLIAFDPLIECEYVFLSEKKFDTCLGCQKCLTHGIDHCELEDDFKKIKKQIDAADGVILASPVYALGVPAIFKALIDRFAYLKHRPAFFDKTFLNVITEGLSGYKHADRQMRHIVSGGKFVSTIHLKQPPVPKRGKDRSLRKLNRVSIRYYRKLRSPKRKTPTLYDWGWFYTFKTLSKSPIYKSYFPKDYEYYKDKKHYFYKVRGHFLMRIIGWFIGLGFKVSLKAQYDLKTNDGQLFNHRRNFHDWLETQNDLD